MTQRVVVLTGGVGGAKLVLGLCHVLPPEAVTAVVNTGDDFRHMGMHVSPDIDTLLYTLAGKANPAQGWGRADESWQFMAAIRELGGEDWFQLGDGDLALHVLRTMRLASGETLSAITAAFARAWGIGATILPMSDAPVQTQINTTEGLLPFQRYFVERRCAPRVRQIRFEGSDTAKPTEAVLSAIAEADAILIAPSNPFLSIDPLLALPDLRAALRQARAPVVAVSPLVRGQAVKGPTAKLMQELGVAVDNTAIASHYSDLLDGLVIHDDDDAPEGLPVLRCDTLMTSLDDKTRVAAAALALTDSLR